MDVYHKLAVFAKDLLRVSSSLVCSESWVSAGRKSITDNGHSQGEKNSTIACLLEKLDLNSDGAV